MSLILEALRKSEAERRRGQAPGLFVEQVPVATRRRARTPAWVWGLGVLLVAVIAAWAWREWQREPARSLATAPTSAGDARPPAASMDATSASLPVTVESPNESSAPDNARAGTPPSRPANPAAPLIGTVAGSPPAVTTAQTTAQTIAPVPTSAPTPTQAQPPAPQAAVVPSPVASGNPPDEPMRASPSPRAPAMPLDKTPEPAAEDALPRLAELPASERGQLPPLKLTMHVYTDDPAQRFVILDGQRLREGASPAGGVVLEQIRRDGLVLSVNGRRVLLARP